MPKIVVISDIHVGHPAAVWPKSFTAVIEETARHESLELLLAEMDFYLDVSAR